MPRKKKRWWQKLRPKKLRAGANVGIAHLEAEWVAPKPHKRRRKTKRSATTAMVPAPVAQIVYQSPPPMVTQPAESRDPLDRFLDDVQDHFSAEATKHLKRKRYGDAVVAAAVATGVHRARKKPPTGW